MKTLLLTAKYAGVALLCSALVFTCKKANDIQNPDGPADSTSVPVADLDKVSDHLQLLNATKNQGTAPAGPAATSLKLSVRDTLSLYHDTQIPVKFLHEDTTKNVSGVFIQVIGGSHATYYYDVPELADIADNDTVSVILVGIDREGLDDPNGVPPAGIRIKLVPHDDSGQPLGEITLPLDILGPKKSGKCGLITRPGDYWEWELSYRAINNVVDVSFINAPDKLWGAKGQFINGCCFNGQSFYDTKCAADTSIQRPLRFFTFFSNPAEIYKFFEDGTYISLADNFSAIPDPKASDFCNGEKGVVNERFARGIHEGNWTISRLPASASGDSLSLSLQGTSSIGANAVARPNGMIRVLNCKRLIIVKPDPEVGGTVLVSNYAYRDVTLPEWNPFP